jgi:hypothetical protein
MTRRRPASQTRPLLWEGGKKSVLLAPNVIEHQSRNTASQYEHQRESNGHKASSQKIDSFAKTCGDFTRNVPKTEQGPSDAIQQSSLCSL